jgi:hypothetical protein
MAATVTTFKTTAGNGQTATLYKIVETSVQASTEYSIVAPTFGTIVAFKAQLVSGTGATIKPILGTATGFTADTFEEIADTATAAAYINDVTVIPYALGNAFVASPQNVGTMTIRSTPNAGTNNAVTTIIVIVHGMA